jgi:thiol-disulfide isomerase/thioredoxin
MRKKLPALMLLFVTIGAAAQGLLPSPPVAAPVLALPGVDGRVHRLADYRGKVVLVNFWASWCGPCREEMPSLERLRRSLRGDPFVVLTVNEGESAQTVREFAKETRLGTVLLLDRDGGAARAWGARALPSSFVVGPDGRIHYSRVGALDWLAPGVRRSITGLMRKLPSLQTAWCPSHRG